MSDIVKGRMAVYTSDHSLRESRIYYTRDGMKRIMSEWMNDYPGHYIQIRPYCEQKQIIRLEILEKEKAVRPPAVYSNVR